MGATNRWNLVPDMTVVVLTTDSLEKLLLTHDYDPWGDQVLEWEEPDYDNVLTAIAINPACELKWLASLPLLGGKSKDSQAHV
jgi:hypothetical protein